MKRDLRELRRTMGPASARRVARASSRTLRVAIAAASLLALLVVPAIARADDGLAVTRSHPDLSSAQVVSPQVVDACFDKPIATTFNINDGNLRLLGYTEYRKSGTGPTAPLKVAGTPTVDPRNPNCALVSFTGPGDARTFSRLVVDAGAVTDTPASGGLVNLRGSVPLNGSIIPPRPGIASLPILTAVSVNAPAAQVTYTFSQPLSGVNPGQLGFYTTDPIDLARYHPAAATVGFQPGVGANTVTVSFSVGDAPELLNATRFVAQEGAAQNSFFQNNPPGAVAAPGTSGQTTRPDLVPGGGRIAIATGGPPPSVATTVVTYTFLFDKPVTVANVNGFELFDASGAKFLPSGAGAVSVSSDGHQVSVPFSSADPKADPAEVTIESVIAGAVTTQGTTVGNTEGSAPVAAPADHPGLTTGPDLLSWSIDRTRRTVTLGFDEIIPVGKFTNATVPTAIGPTPTLAVFDANGTLTGPTGDPGTIGFGAVPAVTQNQNLVTLHYGSAQQAAMNNAVGVSLAEGAVVDALGVSSPLIAYGEGHAPVPPPPVAAPVCTSQSVVTSFNTPKSITLSCTAPADQTQTYSIVSGPLHGSLSGLPGAGQVTYTPTNGYSGADAFTFTSSDAAGGGNTATVNITVRPGTPPPPPKPCHAAPHTRFDRSATRVSRTSVSLAGTSVPGTCRGESAADEARGQVAKVQVFIYKVVNGRCQFMGQNGGLYPLRDCNRPFLLFARGTNSWTLKFRGHITRGFFHVRAQAIDQGHDHELPSAFTTFGVR